MNAVRRGEHELFVSHTARRLLQEIEQTATPTGAENDATSIGPPERVGVDRWMIREAVLHIACNVDQPDVLIPMVTILVLALTITTRDFPKRHVRATEPKISCSSTAGFQALRRSIWSTR